ncbi:MAG: mandelate racemase [Firmicutes bacterium]|nr:mandelate racemase [Bacillota bacterium]
MKIVDLKATTVSVPLEAPLRHSNGEHWGRFVRTIVEVVTDEGLIGLGEMGGGGESAELQFQGLKPYLIGHDPFDLEGLRFKICNPTASLYNNRTQLMAAIEFACLDLIGQSLDLPVHKFLGGKLRDEIPFASYLFFRYESDDGLYPEVRTVEQLINHTRELKEKYGFQTHKLKAGVFPPKYELEAYQALAQAFPEDSFRIDPNACWSVEQSIWFARQIEDFPNDYLEDPTWGLNGMRRVRENTTIPLATNTVVVNFEQLAQNVLHPAVDVILLDTTFWGGIRACIKAAAVCETFQLGTAVHSSGELGIQLSTMLHLGAVLPNLSFAIDAHYHHLRDDLIVGGKLEMVNGKLKVPEGPGLGVTLDRDKLAHYAELYRKLGSYPYDRDSRRKGWYPLLPNERWADPEE